MIASITIGALIFFYAGWSLYRFIVKSKAGKCSGCSQQKDCSLPGCNNND